MLTVKLEAMVSYTPHQDQLIQILVVKLTEIAHFN